MTYHDSVEPPEPVAPGQADPAGDNILEPRCWCGRLLEPTRAGDLLCLRHGEDTGPNA